MQMFKPTPLILLSVKVVLWCAWCAGYMGMTTLSAHAQTSSPPSATSPVSPSAATPLTPPLASPQAAPEAQKQDALKNAAPNSTPALVTSPISPTILPPATTSAPPAPSSPTPSPKATLIPQSGDSVNVDVVTLPAKPAAFLKGKTSWDNAFERLNASLKTLENTVTQNGLLIAGRPLTMFVETDDAGFTFEMMLPIDKMLEGKTSLSAEVSLGKTPEGKAYRFVHKGSYDDVDSTYEAITAYLDAKGVIAKDSFMEEYVTPFTKSDDPNLEINIFVQPKEVELKK
jgi:effector-binding domain-containing protein